MASQPKSSIVLSLEERRQRVTAHSKSCHSGSECEEDKQSSTLACGGEGSGQPRGHVSTLCSLGEGTGGRPWSHRWTSTSGALLEWGGVAFTA